MHLLVIGNVPVDLVMRVPHLPQRDEDVESESFVAAVGGAFHVIRAAADGGLRSSYAGAHGTGPYGELVRRALTDAGAKILQPPMAERDTGVVMTLVEPSGERSFVTAPHAVAPYPQGVLDGLLPTPEDLVYVSGYSVGAAGGDIALAHWISTLSRETTVFFDLGPRGVVADAEVLAPVFGRVDWLACNAIEATQVTGESEPKRALQSLAERSPQASLLMRVGSDGCWLIGPETEAELIPADEVGLVASTNGAGDTHSGAFLAALAEGLDPAVAVRKANVTAAQFLARETVAG